MKFDRLAPHYDWLEAVTAGRRLQRVRQHWLGALRDRRRLLSAGEGHGRFAAACAARFPGLAITCVEASAGMLARARRRVRGASQPIVWEHADLLAWTPPAAPFDAIATCFFLDCFPAPLLHQVVAKLAACATSDAVWLVADFAVPARGLARWRARGIHAVMYAFFRAAVSLPARRLVAPDDALAEQGFRLAGRHDFEWGLLRADLWRR
jgi:ubiquinone/menaquinone biosynthesis C-methylase UbiE